MTLLELYVEEYPLEEDATLFPWSRRRIQQILEDLRDQAELNRKVTPSKLRWTYALTTWKEGVTGEEVQRYLGLSELGWRDVQKKLKALC